MSEQLETNAQKMVADSKGILAADESTGTIGKRFDSVGAECTEDNRRNYREMMFRADAMADCISGVILYDETLRQKAKDGTPLLEVISATGALPGIKVDTGAKDLAGAPGEKITEGLDALRERFAEYHDLGARFAKWRAVITIGDHIPSHYCIEANAHALARYAALAQEANIVPIVEPEVLMDGDHSIDDCQVVSEEVLRTVFAELTVQEIELEGMLLKPNMVISGTDCPEQAGVEEVARRTVETLKRTVPAAMPGIVFLSGGQSDEVATQHLNAMNKLGERLPWQLSFSYGRALQAAPLKAWAGNAENLATAQSAFLERAKANGAATLGTYA